MSYKEPDLPNPRLMGQRCHYSQGHQPQPPSTFAGPYCNLSDRAHCVPVPYLEMIGPQPAPEANGTAQAPINTQLTLTLK